MEPRHIRTLAGQTHSRAKIDEILDTTDYTETAALFIVSGGHPARKIIKMLEEKLGCTYLAAALNSIILGGVDSISIA